MAIEGGLKNFLEIVFVFLSPGVTLTKPTLVDHTNQVLLLLGRA